MNFDQIFCLANNKFIMNEVDLIKSDVSERCICGSFKSFLEREIQNTKYKDYYVDVEYNRNAGHIKTIINEKMEIIQVTCDIIIHSRGKYQDQDNLIAIEVKKSYQSEENKLSDRNRLIALTKTPDYNNVWSYDGKVFPKNVCGYLLGVYYEIDVINDRVLIEYFRNGLLSETFEKKFSFSNF